jgi:hypothetical protein
MEAVTIIRTVSEENSEEYLEFLSETAPVFMTCWGGGVTEFQSVFTDPIDVAVEQWVFENLGKVTV